MKSELFAEVGAVCVKAVSAAAAAVWAHLHNVAPYVAAFSVLVMVDMVMGLILAHRKDEQVTMVKLVKGPAILMFITALLMLSASVIDERLGVEIILYSVSSYLLLSAFYTVAVKYKEYTGKNVWEAIPDIFKKKS